MQPKSVILMRLERALNDDSSPSSQWVHLEVPGVWPRELYRSGASYGSVRAMYSGKEAGKTQQNLLMPLFESSSPLPAEDEIPF